jgi:hypothetical protein
MNYESGLVLGSIASVAQSRILSMKEPDRRYLDAPPAKVQVQEQDGAEK